MGTENGTGWLERITEHRFKNSALAEQALTHTSYANEHRGSHNSSNERLEFLGDAVLELVSSEYLYGSFPDWNEGELTRLRASLVCEPALAGAARKLGLPEHLLLGHGEDLTGGRERDSVISDALEAVIGALYLDGGPEAARPFILKNILNDIGSRQVFSDSKTVLQELMQGQQKGDVVYRLLETSGPDHCRSFTAGVFLHDEMLGSGTGRSRKAAEQAAAAQALRKLENVQG